jgi:hypothetical protein
MSRIDIRLNESDKEEWEEFVTDSPAIGSMSALVRQAVFTYIADDDTPDEFEMVVEAMESLENAIYELERVQSKTRTDIVTETEMVEVVDSIVRSYAYAQVHDLEFTSASELPMGGSDEF